MSGVGAALSGPWPPGHFGRQLVREDRGLAATPQGMAVLEGPNRRALRRGDGAAKAPSPTPCAPEHETAWQRYKTWQSMGRRGAQNT